MSRIFRIGLSVILCFVILSGIIFAGYFDSGDIHQPTGQARGSGKIHLKGGIIDPKDKNIAKEASSYLMKSAREEKPQLFIVQFKGPVTDENKNAITSLGVQLGDYLPEFAFFMQATKSAALQVAKLETVNTVLYYEPELKIHKEFKNSNGSIRTDRQKLRIHIITFNNSGAKLVSDRLKSKNIAILSCKDKYCVAEVQPEILLEIAQYEEVVYIEEIKPFKLLNDRAAGVMGVPTVWNLPLTGKGQTVAICDTGLDTGINNYTMHLDFQGRIKGIYPWGRSNDASDPDGHGTHVAGSIVGNGYLSGGLIKGPAYEADLVFQSVMDENGGLSGIPYFLYDLFNQAYDHGARIHNNSWGGPATFYDTYSSQVDQYTWNHKDMVILFAAGNEGNSGNYSLLSPGIAKNCITVGATDNNRPELPPKNGHSGQDINRVTNFSSRGPTPDGRIKPDLVAPGSFVLSTLSSVFQSKDPDDPWYPFDYPYNPYYVYNSGTSMVAPLVSGTSALVRQYYMETRNTIPSASLIKATLINGAVDLGCSRYDQGWGRVDLENSIPSALQFINETDPLTTGKISTYCVAVNDISKPLKFSLVWTDFPANIAAQDVLVNDIDLQVIGPDGIIYNGNDFSAPYNDYVDGKENVEKVILNFPKTGLYTIRVIAHNVPCGPQPYSLVSTGGIVTQPLEVVAMVGNNGNMNTEGNAGQSLIRTGYFTIPKYATNPVFTCGYIATGLGPDAMAILAEYLNDTGWVCLDHQDNSVPTNTTFNLTGKIIQPIKIGAIRIGLFYDNKPQTNYSNIIWLQNAKITYTLNALNTTGLLSTPVVSAVSNNNSITISWEPVPDATWYEIEFDGAITNVTSTSHIFNGLTANTLHSYRVRAKSADKYSLWTGLLPKRTAPVVPTVTASFTNTSVTLTWGVTKGASGYEVEVDGVIKPSSISTVYTDNGLIPNTQHRYRVRSENRNNREKDGGTSDWSEEIIVTTLLTTPVVTPTSTNNSITLSWDAITDATSYEIEFDAVITEVTITSHIFNGLNPGSLHKFKVRAKSGTNYSNWTTLTNWYTLSGVPTVTVNPASTTISLSWGAITGATGYEVEVDGNVQPSITTTTYTHNGPLPNTQHTYRVRSKNASGVSDWSSPVIIIKTLLTTLVVTATSSTTSITLSWSAVTDATGYEIEFDGAITEVTTTSHTFDGLMPYSLHKYRVRAKSADNNYSALPTLVNWYTAPAIPTVTANPTSTTIVLSWGAITGATGYEVEVDGIIKPVVTTATYTHSGLLSNTQHSYRVRSKNSYGVSLWTEVITVSTLLTSPVVVAIPTDTSITLTWDVVTDATSYKIEFDGVIAEVTNTSHTFNVLNPGTLHKYKVQAKSENNFSTWPTSLTNCYTLCAIPNVTISPTSISIVLSWGAITGATGYEVEVDGVIKPVITTTTYTHSGLTPNTPHTYRVRTKNTAGVSGWTQFIPVKTLLTTPVVTAISSTTSITLSWGTITDATSYEIEFDGVITEVTATSHIYEGLAAYLLHKYRVRAKSADNYSANPSLVNWYTAPVIPIVTANPTSTSVVLSWGTVTGVTGYEVEADGVIKPVVTTTTYTQSGLVPNTQHTYRVRSKNSYGVSPWTEVIPARTLLTTPVVTATSSITSITLSWGVITDATGYEIKFDGVVTENITDTSYTFSGLTANTSHSYEVRAKSADNFSAWTTLVSRYTAPVIPTVTAITPASNSIKLDWLTVTGATGYEVEADGVIQTLGKVITYTHSGLTPNTQHTYRVRSKNTGGVSEWTELTTIKTLLGIPVVTATSTTTSITFSWGVITDATGYEIEFDGSITDNVTTTSYTYDGLAANTVHNYRVRAKNVDNFSAWTNLVSRYTAPLTPVNLTSTQRTSSSITVTWGAVTGATKYEIEADGVVKPEITTTTYTHSGLASNTQHSYRVRSKNSYGVSEWSDIFTQTTL